MPYHIDKSENCQTSKPYAVIKDSDGKIMGCHPTREAAGKQIAAIEANEKAEWEAKMQGVLDDSDD